jgi:hypothetical protein
MDQHGANGRTRRLTTESPPVLVNMSDLVAGAVVRWDESDLHARREEWSARPPRCHRNGLALACRGQLKRPLGGILLWRACQGRLRPTAAS